MGQSMPFLPGVSGHVSADSLTNPYAFLARVPVSDMPLERSDIDMTCERPAKLNSSEWDFMRGRSPTRSPSPPNRGKNRSSGSTHSCRSCESTFGRSDTLLRHEREFHRTAKPHFKCGNERWGCGRAFTRESTLKHHQKNTRRGQQCIEEFERCQSVRISSEQRLEYAEISELAKTWAMQSRLSNDIGGATLGATALEIDPSNGTTPASPPQEPPKPQAESRSCCNFCGNVLVSPLQDSLDLAILRPAAEMMATEPLVQKYGKVLHSLGQTFHLLYEQAIASSCTHCSKEWRLESLEQEFKVSMWFVKRGRLRWKRKLSRAII